MERTSWRWACLIALACAATAYAEGDGESDAAEGEGKLAPIVVSGDKLGRKVSESAASVGVATAEDLESGTDNKMHEVVSRYGNVLRVGGDREIAIRGIPQSGIAGEGETISVYLDGVALPQRAASFAGPLSTFDLEQVEVLRGPQSTSQGRNSLAGAVILQTKDPTPYWDGHAKVADMSHDGHQYAFAGGGPLLGDQLMFRVAYDDQYDRGDIYNVTRDEDDAGREIQVTKRAKLTLAPHAWPGYRATLSATQVDNEFGDTLHAVTYGERTASANVRYDEDYHGDVYSLEQFMLLGDAFDLTAITGWVDGDGFRIADFGRTEEEDGFSTFDLVEERASQELRLGYEGRDLRAVFGLYYEDGDAGLRNEGEGVPVGGGLATLSGFVESDDQTRTAAAFTEMDWGFLESWRLTLGLRWNHEWADRHARSDFSYALQVTPESLGLVPPLPPGLIPPIPLPDALSDQLAAQGVVPPDYDERQDEDFSVLLPKVGLTWEFLYPHSLSLTYQEGYRSGGASISFFNGSVSIFDPEFTETVELALRTRWLDERLELNLNAFRTRWEDQQVLIGDGTGFDNLTTNAGRSHLYGGEAELLWRFAPHLETFASLGLLETEFDEFVNEGQDFSGNEFPFAPDYTATLGLALLPWHDWEGQVSVQRTDEYFSYPDNLDQQRVSPRTLVNARVAYALLPSLKLFAFGRNLTDDDNIQAKLARDGRLAHRYGESRTLGMGVEWKP